VMDRIVQSADAMQTQNQNATQCFSNQLCNRYGRERHRAISDCVLCLVDMSGNCNHPLVDFFTICIERRLVALRQLSVARSVVLQ
jgi:hypothetical protein